MDDNDWIFDYVLQFLESDRFDAAVMDFVDEKCDVFDNDEENKFIYTDIYNEFIEHMETIISSHLAELDITSDTFYEACQSSRSSRDINRAVFEKMLAMEDFTVFKKIMVKRNMELQYEAMQSYKHYHEISQYGLENDLSHLPDPDELEAMLENREEEIGQGQSFEQIEQLYRESLLELELIHKQEEMEQLELEQALALSLLAEEERLRRARVEAKNSASSDEIREASTTSGAKDIAEEKSSSKSSSSSSKASSKSVSGDQSIDFADPKPLKMNLSGGMNLSPMKALPPISAGKKPNLTELNANFLEKRKLAENAFKQNQQQISEKKRAAEELTKDIPAAQAEAEKRAQYMREQRDKLIALKKKEREEKVREEEERKLKSSSSASSPPKTIQKQSSLNNNNNNEDDEEEYDSQEQQRAILRMALARKMKQSLLESEEAKQVQQQEDSFSLLDKKLQDVERQRQENHQRELILQENLRRQQAQMARNVQRSAAQMRSDES